jgi:hypothetical protein
MHLNNLCEVGKYLTECVAPSLITLGAVSFVVGVILKDITCDKKKPCNK